MKRWGACFTERMARRSGGPATLGRGPTTLAGRRATLAGPIASLDRRSSSLAHVISSIADASSSRAGAIAKLGRRQSSLDDTRAGSLPCGRGSPARARASLGGPLRSWARSLPSMARHLRLRARDVPSRTRFRRMRPRKPRSPSRDLGAGARRLGSCSRLPLNLRPVPRTVTDPADIHEAIVHRVPAVLAIVAASSLFMPSCSEGYSGPACDPCVPAPVIYDSAALGPPCDADGAPCAQGTMCECSCGVLVACGVVDCNTACTAGPANPENCGSCPPCPSGQVSNGGDPCNGCRCVPVSFFSSSSGSGGAPVYMDAASFSDSGPDVAGDALATSGDSSGASSLDSAAESGGPGDGASE